MNLTLSIDERTVKKARKISQSLGKSLNQMIREYLQGLSSEDSSIAELRRLPATGDRKGWKFNRDEIHERTRIF